MEKINNIATKVIALGGLGEVGKNMYIVEHNDEITKSCCFSYYYFHISYSFLYFFFIQKKGF